MKKKVVTIGGGTGSFMLLSGLKEYPIELSAIVSMADDGGSSGVHRDELGVLPPGDIRQCLVALSDSPEIMRKLMSYRFSEGGLDGHSFGNLFLSALEKVTGDFSSAVREASDILQVRGSVIPVTKDDTHLYAKLKNGKMIRGENAINVNFNVEKVGIERIYLEPAARANTEAVKKILEADLIIIGPGNHYCSIIPNLLVRGIPEALRKTRARIVYNCNLVNKWGHTNNFSLDDYVDALHGFIGKPVIDFVTYNTRRPGKALLERYQEQESGSIVAFDESARPKRSYRIVKGDLLSSTFHAARPGDKIAATRSLIRHDSKKLAKMLMLLLEIGDYESILKEIV